MKLLTEAQEAQLVQMDPKMGVFIYVIRQIENNLKKAIEDMTPELTAQATKSLANEIKNIRQGNQGPPGRDGVRVVVQESVPGPKGKNGRDADPELSAEMAMGRLKHKIDAKVADIKKELISLIPDKIDIDQIIETVMQRMSVEKKEEVLLDTGEKQPIKISDIEGLQQVINTLTLNINTVKNRKEKRALVSVGGGGGMGNWVTDNAVGDGATQSYTLSYKVASGGTAIMVLLNGQVQELGTHYTVNNITRQITFIDAPFDGAAIHIWYVRA